MALSHMQTYKPCATMSYVTGYINGKGKAGNRAGSFV